MKKYLLAVLVLAGVNCWAEAECSQKVEENVNLINASPCWETPAIVHRCGSTLAADIIKLRTAAKVVCLKDLKLSKQDKNALKYISNKCAVKYSSEEGDNKALGISYCELEGAVFLNDLLKPFVEPVI